MAACPGPPEALQGPAAKDGRGTLRLEAALPARRRLEAAQESALGNRADSPPSALGHSGRNGCTWPRYQGSPQRCQSVEDLSGDLTSPRCWVLAKLTWGRLRGHLLSTLCPQSPSPSHLSDTPCRWPLEGFGAWVHALGSFPEPPRIQSSAPAVTGCLAATPATETSELLPEVALGQQASALWQWLPGSTRPALAAVLATAGASGAVRMTGRV